MGIRLGSNIEALRAQRQLNTASNALGSTYQKLSTGLRINKAADDAAGLAISERLNTDSRVHAQAVRNVNDVVSLLNIADSAIEALSSIISRQQELATQAANGTLTDAQRDSLNTENSELAAEYRRVIETTEFNGVNVFTEGESRVQVQIATSSLTVQTSEVTGAAHAVGTGLYTTENETFGFTASDDNRYLVKDLNSDGIDDLIVLGYHDRGGGETRLRYSSYLGQSAGSGFTILDSGIEEMSPSGADSEWRDFRARFGSGNNVELYMDDDVTTKSGTLQVDSSGNFTSFTPGVFTGSNESSTFSTTGDFNGDGVLDIVQDISSTQFQFQIQQTTLSPGPLSLLVISADTNDTVSLTNRSTALNAIDTLGEIQATVIRSRSEVGVSTSRLETAARVTEAARIEFEAAGDRIRSADIAHEASEIVRLNLVQSTASAIFAQANQQPQLALSLLGA